MLSPNESIVLLVEFVDRAALGDGPDAGVSDGWAARSVNLEGIPIADPEIQLVIFRGAALREVSVVVSAAALAGAMKTMARAADAMSRRVMFMGSAVLWYAC